MDEKEITDYQQKFEENCWGEILESLSSQTFDATEKKLILSQLEVFFEYKSVKEEYFAQVAQVLSLCLSSALEGQLKIRGKKKKQFHFIQFDSWEFPSSTFNFLKHVVLQQPVLNSLQFLDSINPYPSRFVDLISEVPESGLIVIQDPNGGNHISCCPVEQENTYLCFPRNLLCYPVKNKDNRHLGPKTFKALGWCTFKFDIEMGDKPLLQPRGSATFHLSFALIGYKISV